MIILNNAHTVEGMGSNSYKTNSVKAIVRPTDLKINCNNFKISASVSDIPRKIANVVMTGIACTQLLTDIAVNLEHSIAGAPAGIPEIYIQNTRESHSQISPMLSDENMKIAPHLTMEYEDFSDLGVLLASHGDIDSIEEVEDYVKTAYLKNDAIPIPAWMRKMTLEPAYKLTHHIIENQYLQTGKTNYRENSFRQAESLTQAFEKNGIKAKAYYGFNFTEPFISQTLEKMQKEGIRNIVMLNQGAQFSYATGGENIKDVLEYLKDHPEWDVKVVAVKQFSNDTRFREILKNSIERDVEALFPGEGSDKVCVIMGSHGLPIRLMEMGDPAVVQMKELVSYLEDKIKSWPIYHGFLNDDFFPGAKWISPEISKVADDMAKDGCKKVAAFGTSSFTVHHRATLYDLNIVARERLTGYDNSLNINSKKTDDNRPGISSHKDENSVVEVKLAPNFDGDKSFANFLQAISIEALQGKGDVQVLREHNI